MTSVALVHSPLVGASMWEGVALELADRGLQTTIVSLADDLLEPSFWDAAAHRVRATGADAVVLYSASGLMAPALVDGCDVVFLDAQLPRPAGGTWWETAPDPLRERLESVTVAGTVEPFWKWWGEAVMSSLIPDRRRREAFQGDCPHVPRSLLDAPVPAGGPPNRAGYIRLSEGYAEQLKVAAGLGWPTRSLDGSHLMPITGPILVAAAVEEVVHALLGSAS